MIALPAMGPSGMEHWGLITYREVALLYSPKDSALVDKMAISNIINHEVAHQVNKICKNQFLTSYLLRQHF